jgi:hypothetical protein
MKRRTHYPNPLAMLMPAPKSQRDALMLRFYSALEAISKGSAPGQEEWRDLADACNVLETLVEQKRLPIEASEAIEKSISALHDAAIRYRQGKAIRLSATGLQALRDTLVMYEQCLALLTERQMHQAAEATAKRLRDAIAGKSGANVIVV